ncbi:hypothetical protein QR680_007546 [Steinernema hermaphroditum]|uniref:G-protein coupled receptors family 1 profile domain-containing protein n=1 Tax=Steinernema hermaphroditum TaxID=289476 RepID=A0AA39IDI2_9BILA|nr:hypothetical protein QR680_007546 [Steinernema hermaphroditum]
MEQSANENWLMVAVTLCNYLAGGIAAFLNLLIVAVCFALRKEELGAYRFFIAAHALVDLLYTLVSMSINLTIFIDRGVIFLVPSGIVCYLPHTWAFRVFLLTSGFLLLNIIILPVSFLYRYIVLCSPNSYHKVFKFHRVLVACLLVGLLCVAFMISGVWVMNQQVPFESLFTAVRHTAPLSKTSVQSWLHFDATITLTFPFVFYVSVLCGCLMATYTSVVAFSVNIFRTLRRRRQQMTPKTVKMHARLTKSLIYQAVFPVFLLLLPLITVFAAVICNVDAKIAGPIMAMTITWQPVANAVCIMSFVRPIHKFVLMRSMMSKNHGRTVKTSVDSTLTLIRPEE